MPRVRRILLPLLLLIAPLPAAAQTAGNVVTPAPPPQEGTVGPEQLRDFALPGTRTAPAQPETAQPAPTTRPRIVPPAISEVEQERPTSSGSTTAPTERPSATRDAQRARTADTTVDTSSAPSATAPLPSPTPAQTGTAEPGFTPSPPLAAPAAEPISMPEPSSGLGPSISWWPWALAAAMAGVALFLFLRRRRAPQDEGRLAFVGLTSGDVPVAEPAPAPAPQPEPQVPPAANPPLPSGLVTTRLNRAPAPVVDPIPAPAAAPAPVGLVSSRLRPSLELDVGVLGIQLTDDEAVIQFELELLNTGSVPARDVVVEVLPLNAGEDQDREIAEFFARQMGSAKGIDALAPLGRMSLRNEVRMPRAAIREYAVEGARVFVPVLAFTGAYRWSGGEGRTSAAWLLGRRSNGSEKLGPLRLDQGPRVFTAVGQKRLDLAVRR